MDHVFFAYQGHKQNSREGIQYYRELCGTQVTLIDEVTTLADRILSIAKGRVLGWANPPLSLMTRVVGHVGDAALLQVDGADADEGRFAVPMRARLGERVRVGFPLDSVMISGTHPGRSSALATLPGDVQPSKVPDDSVTVDVYGQALKLPAEHGDLTGTRVWLSILRAMPRPEVADSNT